MSTKPKRKYGSIRTGEETASGTNEDVFRSFGLGSPVTGDSPSTDASPTTHASPVILAPQALPSESPSTGASPVVYDSPKPRQESEYRKGDSRVNHDFFDARLCGLPPLAQLLYFHLNRYREGGSNLTIPITWGRLEDRIGKSESMLRRAYKELNRAALVFVERAVYGKDRAQGLVFRVVTGASPSASASPSTGDTHKSVKRKENLKGEDAPQTETTRCDLCAESGGFIYPDPKNPSAGVVRCTHAGKGSPALSKSGDLG